MIIKCTACGVSSEGAQKHQPWCAVLQVVALLAPMEGISKREALQRVLRQNGMGDDIEDMLRKLNEEVARNPPQLTKPLPEGWCRCGDGVCACGVNGGGGFRTRPQVVFNNQFQGLEGDWCRAGLPGGIKGLRAALRVAQDGPAAPAAPVTVQTVSEPATARPAAPRKPWTGYLSYVLRKRGYLP